MRLYFYCVEPGTAEQAGYEHGLVALAEGLVKLGHVVAGCRSYWDEGGGVLIPQSNEAPEAYEVVLVSHEWYLRNGSLPPVFQSEGGPFRVYVDLSDGWRTTASSESDWPADLILRAHYNRHFRYSSKVKPWAFGLTSRMIRATSEAPSIEARPAVVSCNFRVGHPVRDRMTRGFRRLYENRFTWDETIDTTPPTETKDLALWVATGRRHNPAYFYRLKAARISLAFGGFFAPNFASAQQTLLGKLSYRGIQRFGWATHTLTQFDSWRWWESLAAGCLTVHCPLDDWGAELPVQPIPGEHYWSFDGRRSVEGGAGGKEWVLKHYAPEPVALRFLSWIS